MDEQAVFSVRLGDGREFGPANMDVLVQWAREGRLPKSALLVPFPAGTAPAAAPIRVIDEPRLAAIVGAPPTVRDSAVAPPVPDESLATVIPYRNKPALIGYYLAIVGCLFAILLPILGFAMPIAAIILGVKGRRLVKADPRVHGTLHALIALAGGILGVVFALGNFAVFITILTAKK